ncbi:hypothetical protein DM02DRAFT_615604, partial [Periconia macrospinosa]
MHFSKVALILGFVAASPIAASPVPLNQGVAVRDAAALIGARSVEAPLQARNDDDDVPISHAETSDSTHPPEPGPVQRSVEARDDDDDVPISHAETSDSEHPP